jgi:hypothetical protein
MAIKIAEIIIALRVGNFKYMAMINGMRKTITPPRVIANHIGNGIRIRCMR